MTARYSKVQTDGYRDQSWVDMWNGFLSVSRLGTRSRLRFVSFGGPEQTHLAYNGVPRSVLEGGLTGDADARPPREPDRLARRDRPLLPAPLPAAARPRPRRRHEARADVLRLPRRRLLRPVPQRAHARRVQPARRRAGRRLAGERERPRPQAQRVGVGLRLGAEPDAGPGPVDVRAAGRGAAAPGAAHGRGALGGVLRAGHRARPAATTTTTSESGPRRVRRACPGRPRPG